MVGRVRLDTRHILRNELLWSVLLSLVLSRLPCDDLRRHEAEHGPFSDEEVAEARGRIFGSAGSSTGADAA
ncbi:hypothetical protein TPA0906_41330 [Streptomyces olivaceus]|nr:hypothetical protein TPA0906_41330 [Streptomyces olivaceus]